MRHLGIQHPTHETLADVVFRHLGEEIASGSLAPGAPIHDTSIAATLGVSRTPVREAVQRLARIGMIESSPSRFTRVAVLEDQDIVNWREFIGHQLSSLVRVAAVRFSETAREGAAHAVDKLAANIADPERYARSAVELYGYLSSHALNDVHRALFRETSFALTRALRAWIIDPELSRELEESLHRLSAAIRDRDGDAAERSARVAHLIE